jgi:drug/metabolite transporter (DMT)-like permease
VGWILLDETITLRILAGTFIIFGGIALSQIKDYKKALRSKELEAIPVEKK